VIGAVAGEGDVDYAEVVLASDTRYPGRMAVGVFRRQSADRIRSEIATKILSEMSR